MTGMGRPFKTYRWRSAGAELFWDVTGKHHARGGVPPRPVANGSKRCTGRHVSPGFFNLCLGTIAVVLVQDQTYRYQPSFAPLGADGRRLQSSVDATAQQDAGSGPW